MEEIKRRSFLKLARDVSVWAIIPNAMRSLDETAPLLMKYASVDLDQAENFALELHGQFQKGNTGYVLREASWYYKMLEQVGFPVAMRRAAEIQMRFGMLFARAQECTLPWYERAVPMIGLYNRIEAEVLSKLPLWSYPSYHAQLLARRAPLYREMGNLGKSLEQFTSALEKPLLEAMDIDLLVELYYSRAHVWAVVGDEQRWQRDLNLAKKHSQKANSASSKKLFRLTLYTEGEGYKRLAYGTQLNLPKGRRELYAERGIACFKQSHMEKSQWVGHAILSGVAEAQCLIMIDPEESMRRAKSLQMEAQRIYPAIVQKIDRTINIAQHRLL